MNDVRKDFVDLRKIFRDKNPRLYRVIPGFIFSWLRRVIHEEGINEFMHKHRDDQHFDFVRAVVSYFELDLEVNDLENVPRSGGVILAANHPLGGLDALSLLQILEPHRKDVRFIVNDILMNLENLKGFWLGVNKHGKNTGDILKEIDAAYGSGQAICIFPAGLVSRKQNGRIEDLEWKKSFISKSRQYGIPVVPVHISGRNTNFFYNLAVWRKRLGIKANIEMLYLVDEMYKQRGHEIRIRFGKPIPSATFSREHSDQYWASAVKDLVYRLPENGHAELK